MSIETGIARQIRWKRQGAKGSLAGTSNGQIQRRNSGKFALKKDAYTTEAEMTEKQQLLSNRHGAQLVDGSIDGILSPGTFSDLLSSVLRKDFAAVTAITGAGLTIAGAGPTYTVTRAAGSFLTDDIKVGHVVRLTVGALNAANISKNLLVTAVVAAALTVMPVNGVALVAEGPIAGCTVTVQGKVSMVPATGHTTHYYTVEDWNPSVPFSTRNRDVRFGAANLSLPGSGNATIALTAQGLAQTTDSAVYFTAPTAETTSDALVAASGLLLVNGVSQAIVTDLSISIDGKLQPADPVVGSNTRPDIFRGKVTVTGSFTAYFDSATLYDLFVAETEISLLQVLTAGTEAAAEFMAFTLPAIKLNSADGDDAETGQKRTYSFTATYNDVAVDTATEATSILVQDSLAA